MQNILRHTQHRKTITNKGAVMAARTIHSDDYDTVWHNLMAMRWNSGNNGLIFNGTTRDGVCVGRHKGIWTVSIRRGHLSLAPDRDYYVSAAAAAMTILTRSHERHVAAQS
jgi:hypothetical protein